LESPSAQLELWTEAKQIPNVRGLNLQSTLPQFRQFFTWLKLPDNRTTYMSYLTTETEVSEPIAVAFFDHQMPLLQMLTKMDAARKAALREH
jgi:hypothetical protein